MDYLSRVIKTHQTVFKACVQGNAGTLTINKREYLAGNKHLDIELKSN